MPFLLVSARYVIGLEILFFQLKALQKRMQKLSSISVTMLNVFVSDLLFSGIAVFGIPVNLLPFWLVFRKRSVSNFHVLLLILCLSDLLVVSGCFTIYGLTDVWPSFNVYTYPHIAPWLIPIVQIALLTSVYATVLLSFERYVRIIYTCNLKHFKYFHEDNFK